MMEMLTVCSKSQKHLQAPLREFPSTLVPFTPQASHSTLGIEQFWGRAARASHDSMSRGACFFWGKKSKRTSHFDLSDELLRTVKELHVPCVSNGFQFTFVEGLGVAS